MNWDAIGAVGEVGGAVAVVATLGYLAAQIRQNTRTLRTTVHDTQTAGHSEYLIDVARDPVLASIVKKAFEMGPIEAEEERFRFRLLMAGIFIRFQNSFYADRSGSLEPELWGHWSRALDAWVTLPAVRDWWATEITFRNDFSSYVNARIEAGPHEVPIVQGASPTQRDPN